MTVYNATLRNALRDAEDWLNSQMNGKRARMPMWKVFERVQKARVLAERGPTLSDLDDELAEFP